MVKYLNMIYNFQPLFSNVFFNNNSNGKERPTGGDDSWTKADMTYWSLTAGDKAWWISNLKSKQIANKNAQKGGCTEVDQPNAEIYSTCSGNLLSNIGGSF